MNGAAQSAPKQSPLTPSVHHPKRVTGPPQQDHSKGRYPIPQNPPTNMSDQFAMAASFKLAEGNFETFMETMSSPEGLEKTRSFPGNILFEATFDTEDKNTIRIFEIWENKESWDNYMKFRADSGFNPKLMSLLSEAPNFYNVSRIS